MDLQSLTHPYTPGAAPGPESYLLVWDAPNLDMGLGAILGGRRGALAVLVFLALVPGAFAYGAVMTLLCAPFAAACRELIDGPAVGRRLAVALDS